MALKLVPLAVIALLCTACNEATPTSSSSLDEKIVCEDVQLLFEILSDHKIYDQSEFASLNSLQPIFTIEAKNVMPGTGVSYRLTGRSSTWPSNPELNYVLNGNGDTEFDSLDVEIARDCVAAEKDLIQSASNYFGEPDYISDLGNIGTQVSWEQIIKEKDKLQSISITSSPTRNDYLLTVKSDYLTIEEP